MKKIINIFLIIVFLTQILPVQQISEFVFGNPLTKAVPQDIGDAAKENFKSEGKSEFLASIYEAITQHYTNFSQSITDMYVIFPLNHSTDVHTPPPNC
ncbi:MAG: hypothetical protein H7101_09260 [Deinococcales bacterium]|nr:hypothetical protein [Chitinophagaceae bacterium]